VPLGYRDIGREKEMRQWKLLIYRRLVHRPHAASIPLVGMCIALSPCMLTYAQTAPADSAKPHVIRSAIPADQARANLEFEVAGSLNRFR